MFKIVSHRLVKCIMRYKIIDNFLSDEECMNIIGMSKMRLTPSTTWNVEAAKSDLSDYRQSEQTFFAAQENSFIQQIEQRIADVTRLPIENGEGLQIVHYNQGGYYKPHWDYFDPEYSGNKSVLYNRGGQRIATVLMYLTDVEEGGETLFPRVGINVKPEQGKALIWFNVDLSSGTSVIDESTFHEAKPVVKGDKWIMTRWIRERRFR